MSGRARIFLSRAEDLLPRLPADSFDSICTDPPYGLAELKPSLVIKAMNAWLAGDRWHVPDGRGFMGREWDKFVPPPGVWDECYRLLKPGGHMLVFAGARTAGLMDISIRLAGFEIRDSLHWMYGCLDEQTEILVDGRWEQYHSVRQGSHALGYDVDCDEFSWQPIQRVVVFPYSDTAYRLVGANTDQLVTREHRCLVERGGSYVFQEAQEAARQREARVPVLEDLPSLLAALSLLDEGAGGPESDVLENVRQPVYGGSATRTPVRHCEPSSYVPGVWQAIPAFADETARAALPGVLAAVPRHPGRRPAAGDSVNRPGCMDRSLSGVVRDQDDRIGKPCVEGWGDVLPQKGELSASQVRPLPARVRANGSQGRLRDGASAAGGAGYGPAADAAGGCASRGSRSGQQLDREPVPVRMQPGPQTVRGQGHTSSDLARIEPVQYDGIAWCVTVPTGAFVARRNGKVFVTGNSGFPKGLDVSKAIDKAAGSKRQIVGTKLGKPGYSLAENRAGGRQAFGEWTDAESECAITAPATEDAAKWAGWNVALKPAHEPVILARKPLAEGTVAANVLRWGTGAINVDGCTVGTETMRESRMSQSPGGVLNCNGRDVEHGNWQQKPNDVPAERSGRWPPNVLLTHSADCNGECAPDCPVAGLDAQSGQLKSGAGNFIRASSADGYGNRGAAYGAESRPAGQEMVSYGDTGGASRFFPAFAWSPEYDLPFLYQAKAPKKERPRIVTADGRFIQHPTVKPLALMRWLVRLVTPPGGTVGDFFCGTGPTAQAALDEGMRCVACDQDPDSVALSRVRLAPYGGVKFTVPGSAVPEPSEEAS